MRQSDRDGMMQLSLEIGRDSCPKPTTKGILRFLGDHNHANLYIPPFHALRHKMLKLLYTHASNIQDAHNFTTNPMSVHMNHSFFPSPPLPANNQLIYSSTPLTTSSSTLTISSPTPPSSTNPLFLSTGL